MDKELGWAEDLGFNTLRVFLHYLPWKEDKEGFYKRVDQFLEICDQHGIKAILIFFDDVWYPNPKSGKQSKPTKGVHNSGWVQCPGKEILGDLAHDQLKPYVQESGAFTCPAGHQFYDVRWLRAQKYLRSYAEYYMDGPASRLDQRKNANFLTYLIRPESHHFSSWMINGMEAFLKIHPYKKWMGKMQPHMEAH